MSKMFKSLLIASLFLPLWFCVTIIYICSLIDNFNCMENYMLNVQDWICISSTVILLFISLISLVWCLNKVKKISKREYNHTTFTVYEIVKMKNYTTDFLATFILPFFVFHTGLSGNYTQFGLFIICIIYLSLVSIVYYKNNILFTNIFFELFGYSFYEIKTTNGTLLVISTKELTLYNNKEIKVNLIDNKIATFN